MKTMMAACWVGIGALAGGAAGQVYDTSEIDALLVSQLANLRGHVAVQIRQDGREVYRFQAGDIEHATEVHLASFTKTLSAAVVLSLVDEGRLSLNERLGSIFPSYENNGVGGATILDCFGMRHGMRTPIAYEIDRRYTLAQSALLIGATGVQVFPPGSALEYDGPGMQAVGRVCELRGVRSWSTLARERIFLPCDMPGADYLEFDPNPAIAGGARSSADETIRFAQMVINGGVYNGVRVLSDASIERLFTNSTFGLPVMGSPFPPNHPGYPYGEQPDYGFGDWILAQNPDSGHVEEIVGAGAWGSFIWMDRRRGLTAVLITDVPAGTQASVEAALGIFSLMRAEVESHQVSAVVAEPAGLRTTLAWSMPPGAIGARVYGADEPIRDVFDLRGAVQLAEVEGGGATVTPYPYYAVTAVFPESENVALVPGANAIASRCPADIDASGEVDGDDVIAFFAAWDAGEPDGDVNADGGIDGDDVIGFFAGWDRGC